MINFHRITCASCTHFQSMYNLYALSFPQAERRSWDGIIHEITYERKFGAHALVRDDKFVGLFNYWVFDKFFYIEHLAVLPGCRNEGVGAEAMEIFKSQCSHPIVFEVEMPTDSQSIKRIAFYEKLGFKVISHRYAQPPYDGEGDFLLPMQLMTNDLHFATTHFDLIRKTLYRDVYHWEE